MDWLKETIEECKLKEAGKSIEQADERRIAKKNEEINPRNCCCK